MSDSHTVFILGDQLLTPYPALVAAAATGQPVRILMVESQQLLQRLPYQRKKLVLLLSAMRHYAQALRESGHTVDYVKSSSLAAGLQSHLATAQPTTLWMMAASHYTGRSWQQKLQATLDCRVELLPNTQFLLGQHNPIPNPQPDKRYVMESFYRSMRRHFDVLMDGPNPRGGTWNYDKENRKPLPANVTPPADLFFEPDEITQTVMDEVAALPGTGSVAGFGYAVTAADAKRALQHFLTIRLGNFGAYEDAMSQRSHTLFHSVLSPYLNLGLLQPLPVIRAAEAAFDAGQGPINSVEGFIRQILGWREFMYWQYWRQMPGMKQKNAWEANRPVPDFFWDGNTEMACLQHAITRAIDTGYNHHIERLMLLSNFAMLAGLNPAAVNDWFTAFYIDAYDWVMPPNVIGMGLNADGGLTATKPYIASANYINKMGDHCRGCRFNPKKRHGEAACPFNYLYWNFLLEHEQTLRANPRLGRNVLGLRHLDDAERTAVRAAAADFFTQLNPAK